MKRTTGLLLVATAALFVGIMFIPITHADSGKKVADTSASSNTSRRISGSRSLLAEHMLRQQAETAKQDQKTPPIKIAGQPPILNASSPLNNAVFTAIGGRGTQFSELSLLSDWDGREDYSADRSQKADDFSFAEPELDFTLTRTAVSEHTKANGFAENVFYYGDSVGNFWIGVDTNPGINISSSGAVDAVLQVNIPTLIRTGASAGFTLPVGQCTDDQVLVTGIAVNPVADLSDFGAACDTIGEVVYVSIQDTGGCSTVANGQPLRTRVLAFAFTDGVGASAVTPVPAAKLIMQSSLGNNGIALDDDGSLYLSLVDRVQFTGGAIIKATEVSHVTAGCVANPRINRVIAPATSLNLSSINSFQGTTANPVLVSSGVRLTNYSGPSSEWGNIAAIAAGPSNVLYAALARSANTGDSTEGLFPAPAALGAAPSMIISFADTVGGFGTCDSAGPGFPGPLPVADGLADVAIAGQTRVPGVNNFRVFALGNGPDLNSLAAAAVNLVPSTLKIDMTIDPTAYSGLMVDEAGTVFVVSGGTPPGVGSNPSPNRGEVLAFQDSCPADRRADYIDLRGNGLPNPPNSGGNTGDGDSDRFDHIFWQAPLDPISNLPTGISGLSRGFLRYTNRLAPNPISPGVTLGMTQRVLGDDDTTNAQIRFDDLDPGHQVAGGDDQNVPFRGDDDDGAGNSVLGAPLEGGFEFTFGGTGVPSSCVWNSFFLNSNGNLTFGAGDTDNTPTIIEFRAGLPKIAPAWSDLNPNSRAVNPVNFPLQALGFSGVNAFKVRYINVTEFGSESCTTNATNTFAITLSDDGTSVDENSSKPLNPANPIGNNAVAFDLQEGPTDLRWVKIDTGSQVILVAQPPRSSGTGQFVADYSRMDLIGTDGRPVLTGYSIGGLAITNPPGLCASNLSTAATAADNGVFGVIPGQPQLSSIQDCLIGEGTEPTIYEFSNTGTPTMLGPGGEVTLAVPSFDLRFEGNDPNSNKPGGQLDPDKGQVGFYGIGCSGPPNPLPLVVIPAPFVATPTTGPPTFFDTNVINAIGGVTLDVYGSGFFPNEVTTICPGDPGGGIPTERPGKVVSSAATLAIDTNNDGIADATINLTNVTPLTRNHVRATAAALPTAPGTAFPLNVGGGLGLLTVNTSFTAADNNAFMPFVTTGAAQFNTGTRAPVVLSVTATEGDCSLAQDLLITGSSFMFHNGVPIPGSPMGTDVIVTRVFARELTNPSNEINATNFNVVNNTLISARFDFGAANAGKTFLIYATSSAGTSRNLITLPAGAPAGVPPVGNEQGVQVAFGCQIPPVIIPDTFQFGSTAITGTEGCAAVNLSVSRLNPSGGTVSVDYATGDGSATQRSDYEIAAGRLTFAPGETSKNISLLINEDSLVEGTETFTVNLTNPSSGAISGGISTVTIMDDDLVPPVTNPNDDPAEFVCQHYHDFFSREPDPAGLAFWVNEITSCAGNAACITLKRQNVSAAFFLSGEFQETGLNVLRTQRAAFGRRSDNALLRVPYTQFMRDAQQVGRGVVIGQPGDLALLEANKQAYATQIATSSQFILNFPLAQTGAQYVAALFASAGVVPTAGETTAAVTAFAGGGTAGRVAALRSVADSNSVRAAEMNPAFVLMQYYGYLRRNPTDPPDGNDTGYQFWLTKLNSFGGNFVNAQMVQAFLTSGEYRHRFGP